MMTIPNTVFSSECWNAAICRNTCTSKCHSIFGFTDNFCSSLYFLKIHSNFNRTSRQFQIAGKSIILICLIICFLNFYSVSSTRFLDTETVVSSLNCILKFSFLKTEIIALLFLVVSATKRLILFSLASCTQYSVKI